MESFLLKIGVIWFVNWWFRVGRVCLGCYCCFYQQLWESVFYVILFQKLCYVEQFVDI